MKTKAIVMSVVLALLASISPAMAQVTLEGRVADSGGEGVPFASVVLRDLRDTAVVMNTISNFEGNYTLTEVKVGRYELRISAIGYVEMCDTVSIRIPSSGFVVGRQDVLAQDSHLLQGITVEGTDGRQMADRRAFTFGAEELASSYDSFELLKYLPGISPDLESGGVKGAMGGEVLLLINGIKATYNDVRLIPKSKIKRMEMYDIPPARYQNVESVVNIITSPLDDGVVGGIDVQQALSTGFGNNNAYFAWNKGKNKFSIDYALYYRNYNNRTQDTEYGYTLMGEERRLTYHDKSHFGYTTHTPQLKYSFVDEDKTIVELTAKPDYEHQFNTSNGTGQYLSGSEEAKTLTTHSNDITNTWQPSLDAYLWKRLTEKDELSLNAVATVFDVKQDGLDNEEDITDDTPMYYDDRQLHNNKYSFIGEAAYTRTVLRTAKWNTGYRAELAWLHSEADNEFGQFDYRSRFLTQYAYTELTGMYHKLLYRVSLALTHIDNNANDTRVRDLEFTPKAILGYYLRHGQSLRLVYERKSNAPSINALSSNISNVSIDILSTGNPSLRNETQQSLMMTYGWQHKYVDLNAIACYEHTHHPIVGYYEEEGDKYWYKQVNGSWLKDRGVAASAVVKPLGNSTFQLQATLYLHCYTLHAQQLSYSLTTWENSFLAMYNNKNISITYQANIPVYEVDGSYRSLVENQNHIAVSYKVKNWCVTASMLFIGVPSHYKSTTVPGSNIYYSRETNIYNNRNMITLGFSYHFQTGKDKTYYKTLNNADTAKPTF